MIVRAIKKSGSSGVVKLIEEKINQPNEKTVFFILPYILPGSCVKPINAALTVALLEVIFQKDLQKGFS